MSDDASHDRPSPEGAAAGRPEDGPAAEDRGLTISTQYVKDLSVENPNAPLVFAEMQEAPGISVNLDVNVSRLREHSFEVVLSGHVEAKVKAESGEKTAFVVELEYGGLVSVADGTDDERLQQLLLIDAPRYLFPFARNVIAGATRDAGFPPLLINPVDFAKLYQQHRKRRTEAAAEGEEQSGAEATASDTAAGHG